MLKGILWWTMAGLIAVATSAAEDQARADQKGNILKAIFTYDLPYWVISKMFKKKIMGMIGANGTVIVNLIPEQREGELYSTEMRDE